MARVFGLDDWVAALGLYLHFSIAAFNFSELEVPESLV
jgi:hypothetical protein